jgi:hypothetical protein
MTKTKRILSISSIICIVVSYILAENEYKNEYIIFIAAILYILGMSILLYKSIYTNVTQMDLDYIISKSSVIVSWVLFVSFGMYLHISGFQSKTIFFTVWTFFSISLFIFSYITSKRDKNLLYISQSGNIMVIFSIFLFVYFRKNNIFRPLDKHNLIGQNLSIIFYLLGWTLISYTI